MLLSPIQNSIDRRIERLFLDYLEQTIRRSVLDPTHPNRDKFKTPSIPKILHSMHLGVSFSGLVQPTLACAATKTGSGRALYRRVGSVEPPTRAWTALSLTVPSYSSKVSFALRCIVDSLISALLSWCCNSSTAIISFSKQTVHCVAGTCGSNLTRVKGSQTVDLDDLKESHPHLRYTCTKPNKTNYQMQIARITLYPNRHPQ